MTSCCVFICLSSFLVLGLTFCLRFNVWLRAFGNYCELIELKFGNVKKIIIQLLDKYHAGLEITCSVITVERPL